MEDDLAEFRTWVNNATANVANRTEEDWKRARADFKTRTQELDLKQEQFSDELRADYKNLKEEFRSADERYQQNMAEPELAAWRTELLGTWADYNMLSENNIRDAYITFMENVRAKKGNWSNQDWEMAKRVIEELNEQKQQIKAPIPTDTEVKIKALQMEFRTLETAADITN
ncbi:hypothetical protein [Pontibacter oryzae]|nr:hypothetical protein [Pontibacter oryzae]